MAAVLHASFMVPCYIRRQFLYLVSEMFIQIHRTFQNKLQLLDVKIVFEPVSVAARSKA